MGNVLARWRRAGNRFVAAVPFPAWRVERGVAHEKPNLPEKICVACHRPFAWRKKWARDWEQVKYCSDRCRGLGQQPERTG